MLFDTFENIYIYIYLNIIINLLINYQIITVLFISLPHPPTLSNSRMTPTKHSLRNVEKICKQGCMSEERERNLVWKTDVFTFFWWVSTNIFAIFL